MTAFSTKTLEQEKGTENFPTTNIVPAEEEFKLQKSISFTRILRIPVKSKGIYGFLVHRQI